MQKASQLRNKIITLLDLRRYDLALKELNNQTETFIQQNKDDFMLLAEIAGSYITLGNESNDLEAVNKGLVIFQSNREALMTAVTEDSIDYCLGNGFHAIYKITTGASDYYFPTPENVKGTLFDAKQAYLKAFKKINLDDLNDYSIQILTNLGNNLNHSGRIVEALQLFDLVLNHNPSFPQALVSKADGLRYMIQATSCPLTKSLFAEIYRLFNTVNTQNIVLEDIKRTVELGKKKSAEILIANGVSLESLDKEYALNKKEYNSHPENIKYFLDNFMSLSEHGLYCKCNAGKIDDLAIGFPGFLTQDKKIIQLELLHNRLKAEFSLARQLYFEFLNNQEDDNVHYENVINEIVDGIKYERLRVSFRQCFGILDKIAEGICYLFDLDISDKSPIYFESFWNTDPSRWSKINECRNIHLTALYSMACDLNKQNGELGFYKIWRNRLEHGLFSLTISEHKENSWEAKRFSEKTQAVNFQSKTKLLLQLTRAAIFTFVFCVRHELITTKESDARKLA